MAIQWIRVPTFRALVDRTVFSQSSAYALSSLEAWERALKKAAIPSNHPDADYSKVAEAMASGEITFSAQAGFISSMGRNSWRRLTHV
jgi:hypothetical protein